eukprot:55536_1
MSTCQNYKPGDVVILSYNDKIVDAEVGYTTDTKMLVSRLDRHQKSTGKWVWLLKNDASIHGKKEIELKPKVKQLVKSRYWIPWSEYKISKITIKQITTAPAPHCDGYLMVDGVDISVVALVAQIQHIVSDAQNSAVILTINDYTGSIIANVSTQYLESYKQQNSFIEGKWVQIYGKINIDNYDYNCSIKVFEMRPITNFNEITHHFLQCIHAHLHNTVNKIPDINWLIINIFHNKKFINTEEFIMRVLFQLMQLYQISFHFNVSHNRREKILSWIKNIYNLYFTPDTVPYFYAMILHAHRKHCNQKADVFLQNIVQYSQLYLKQRTQNKLHVLSHTFDKWAVELPTSLFPTSEELQFACHNEQLYYLHLAKCTKNLLMYSDISDYYMHFGILMQYIRQNQKSIRSIHIANPEFIYNAIFLLLIGQAKQYDQDVDKQTLIQIRRLCHCFSVGAKLLSEKMISAKLYWIFGLYYFLYTININKALKYMKKSLKIYSNKPAGFKYLLELFLKTVRMMGSGVENKHKSQQISLKMMAQILIQKVQHLRLHYDYMHWKFYEHDAMGIPINSITINNAMDVTMVTCTIKRYINDPKYFNIMKNMAQLKQCNYIKCNRKDLRKYKVCKRCKSVFYCNKSHQKRDWNMSHRLNCVELKYRVYSKRKLIVNTPLSTQLIIQKLFS